MDGLATDIQGVQARAADTIGSIQTILLIATIAITLFFVWILLLNVALWQLGRVWQRDADARSGAAASPAAAEPVDEPRSMNNAVNRCSPSVDVRRPIPLSDERKQTATADPGVTPAPGGPS